MPWRRTTATPVLNSPTSSDFSPNPEELLVTYTYWDDDDTYRRGMQKSMCRGVVDTSGNFKTNCIDTDYYTPVDVGGSSDSDLSDVLGAYAGLTKTETFCTGGSCLDGDGSLVYQTTYLYDDHARAGSVTTVDADSFIILQSEYTYDQYDNVVEETHRSDLDPSDDSNYSVAYRYDGLLRLSTETRSDLNGDLLKKTTYEWDARDNLTKKTVTVPDDANAQRARTVAAGGR